MKSWGAFLILSLFTTQVCVAGVSCPLVYSEHKTESRDFWKEKSILIPTKSGEQALNFSLDSEIQPADSLRYISTNPQVLTAFNEFLKQYSFSLKDLLKLTNMSESQFKNFALKKNIDKNLVKYNLSDFLPESFEKIIKASNIHMTLLPHLTKAVNAVLDKDNSSLEAGVDGENVEFRHQSYESDPGDFKQTVLDLHDKTKRAMTHMHAGIPAAVSRAKVSEIARAAESFSILTLAEDAAVNKDDLSYTNFTSLNRTAIKKDVQTRGVIRLGIEEFPLPLKSHNLELRQYVSLKIGFFLLERISRLAQKHEYLIVTDTPRLKSIPDSRTSNLPGALYHVGKVLGRSPHVEDQNVAKHLLDFAERIYTEGAISEDLRLEVAQFLKKNKPLEKLKLEYYLSSKPTGEYGGAKKDGVFLSIWEAMTGQ